MSMEADMPAAPAWNHAVHDIPETSLASEHSASAEERQAMAQALELPALRKLTANYTIRPEIEGRYHLTGVIEAEIEQICVVSLEPLTTNLSEPFDVSFWPEDQLPQPEGGEVDIEATDAPEPIRAGQIDVGRVVFESLAAAIEPYPRKPGAVLKLQSAAPSHPTTADSPFAVLANVKPRR
jgi:hypothetical protein